MIAESAAPGIAHTSPWIKNKHIAAHQLKQNAHSNGFTDLRK